MSLLKNFTKGPLIISLLVSASVNATDLSSIYTKAAENDHEFRAARAEYLAGLESKNAGRADLLPKLNASGGYSDNTTNPAASDASISSTDTSYGVSLTQPIFDMGAWYKFKAGSADANTSTARFKSEEQALIIRTSQAYFDTLQAASNLETSLSEENALSHQLEQIRQRFEVGLSAITEVHEAQASYDSAVADRLINQGRLAIAFESLEVLTGTSYSEISPLKTDFPVVPPSPAAREEWVSRAKQNNHLLSASKFTAESAKQSAKLAKSGHYPRLILDGSYSDISTDPEEIRDGNNTAVGLKLTVPLYNGGGVSASRRRAQQQSIQARELYLKAQRDVVQSARTEHLAVITTVATVKARKQAIVSTESALEAVKTGYSVGTRNLVNVLDAQRALYQAKRDYYAALYSYVMSTLKLKEVAGMLSATDVVQLNTWLDANSPVLRDSPENL